MTKIKLCGLTRKCDVDAANVLLPEYVGFVFAEGSRRSLTPDAAAVLRENLDRRIISVGVFRNQPPEFAAELCEHGVIGAVQLHGSEDEACVERLRMLIDYPIIRAFRVDSADDIRAAANFPSDYVLLDSGDGGSGTPFDWTLIRDIGREYFLAGGLTPENVADAVREFSPFAVDVSSGIEKDGVKSPEMMAAFVAAVRG